MVSYAFHVCGNVYFNGIILIIIVNAIRVRESFKKVGYDLGELLDATDLSEQHLSVIKDPLAIRKGLYLKEDEVETITNAGRALKHNIDKLKKSGSIHLRAVYEKGKVCD